jgi:hypothetical protein
MTTQDLSFVANLDALASNVRLSKADTRELVDVSCELPWPVKFTMVRYHQSRGPPGLHNFNKSVEAEADKLKCRLAMQNRIGHDEGPSWSWSRHIIAHY